MPGTLPVLFFGDLFGGAEIATVGYNPSHQEYLDRDGRMLTGAGRRFATLDSLGARDRTSLTDAQADEAIEVMRGYFGPGRSVYSWFAGLARVVDGLGSSFDGGAAHLDLVQEATKPAWSALPDAEKASLLDADLPFLTWQIRAFPLRAVICAGMTVSENVRRELRVTVRETGALARVTWWVGDAHVDGRRVAFGGWNLPLSRPTGLGAEGEVALGELLAKKLGV